MESSITRKRYFPSLKSHLKVLPFRSKPRNKPEEKKTASFFHALPIELRLNIYDMMLEPTCSAGLDHSVDGCRTPSNGMHPLYPLLFVSQSLRSEVTEVIYKSLSPSRTLKFISPQHCLFFLSWTSSHVHLLRSLRVVVYPNDTYALEAIFELIIRTQCPLEKLSLVLVPATWPNLAPLPVPVQTKNRLTYLRGMCILDEARKQAEKLKFGEVLDPTFPYFPGVPDFYAKESNISSLGQIPALRYLATDYTAPYGDWAIQFELGLLRAQARMFETAAKEGRKMVLRDSRRRGREFILGLVEKAHWIENAYWIEGTDVRSSKDGVEDLIWMGKYDKYIAPLAAQERKVPVLRRVLGLKR